MPAKALRCLTEGCPRTGEPVPHRKGGEGGTRWGSPPLGSLHGAPTYVDPEVMQHDTVVFAAGTQTESVKVRTEDLFRNEPVTTAPLTRLSADDEGLPNRTER